MKQMREFASCVTLSLDVEAVEGWTVVVMLYKMHLSVLRLL